MLCHMVDGTYVGVCGEREKERRYDEVKGRYDSSPLLQELSVHHVVQ